MVKTWEAQVGRYFPIIGPLLVILTLIICVIIAKSEDVYLGGLDWPYFSDMGRDSPAYYVFAIGLTISGILIAFIWYVNYRYQQEPILRGKETGLISNHVVRMHQATVGIGVASAIGLPILSIFDTANYANLHLYAAYWFVVLEAVATALNTIVSRRLYIFSMANQSNMLEESNKLNSSANEKCIFQWQLVSVIIFWIAFLIYIPIGLAISCSFERLSIADCLAEDLGQDYCTDTVKKNATHTLLWNYSNCQTENQLRAAAQLVVIVSLVGYVMSFYRHRSRADMPNNAQI